MSDFPPGIGPHEGRELELLLSGEKPLAKFTLDGLDAAYERQFDAAVERGEILSFDFPTRSPGLGRRYYCRPGEQWRVKLLELVERELSQGNSQHLTEEDLHRMDGALLGYDRADIDIFVERLNARRSKS